MIRWTLLVLTVGLAQAHEPITTKLTWTREISRLVYKHCSSCHHEGGSAFSLMTYEEARPWAKAIRDEVLERRMPPWGPVKGFGEFRNDASLSGPEIDLVVNWVEGGAPEGEAIYLPSPPVITTHTDPAPPAERLSVRGQLSLLRDATVVGIEATAAVQATAERSDGSIEPLIWIPSYRPLQPKAYYFREPVKLPKGTTIHLAGSGATLLVSR